MIKGQYFQSSFRFHKSIWSNVRDFATIGKGRSRGWAFVKEMGEKHSECPSCRTSSVFWDCKESNHEAAAGRQPNCTGAAAAGADHFFTYSDRSYESMNLLCVFLIHNLAISVANTKMQQQVHHCILTKGRLRE